MAHEVNRAYCLAAGMTVPPAWDKAPQWMKDSQVDGTLFAMNNPAVTPAEVHDNWMAHKQKNGWVFGEIKDYDNKTHPCMVPYDQLPKSERIKDHLILAIVNTAIKIRNQAT